MIVGRAVMNISRNETGAGYLKVLITLLILFLVGHVGYKLVPMYMDFEWMKDEMSVKASMSQVLNDEEIRAGLAKKAKELDLPLSETNFLLKRNEDQHTMTISTMWEVEVHFIFNVYVRTFKFAPLVSADYTKTRR
jgi:hypothetical protein